MNKATTHLNVLTVGAYGDLIKAGQLLKVVSIGKCFVFVEAFGGKETFKVSLKTGRACGTKWGFIKVSNQPSFELPIAA